MQKRITAALVLVLFVGLTLFPAAADAADKGKAKTPSLRLPNVIGSHMVLQRQMELPVWGWAEKGQEVTVKLGANEKTAKAGADGRWMVKLPAMKAGGPYKMTVAAKSGETIELEDILVGEVWVGSGQSNMAWGVAGARNGKQEIAAATYPKIRLFNVPRRARLRPHDDLNAKWQECGPKTAGGFSAVAYFFGRELHKELNVPVGLIATSWGGTRIEPWIPLAGLDSQSELKAIAEKARKPGRVNPRRMHQYPAALYNGMVHGLVPFGIRGAIWYQGESNVFSKDGMAYFTKKKALIGGWRKVWGQGDFPFLYVQLAPWAGYPPGELPKLWEAQVKCLTIPKTGMAVTTDLVDKLGNIHPTNKQDVGKRLALWVLAKTYGRDGLVYSGPIYKSMSIEGNRIAIEFDHLGSGLALRDGKPLTWFTIAGEDKKFVEAKAEIVGDKVVVSSENVAKPAAVRFAWSKVAQPNLMNKEGLPASPFRTDR